MRSKLIREGLDGLPLRFLRQRPLRALMSIAGVALGVGLVVAITILWTTMQAMVDRQERQGYGTYDFSVETPGQFLSESDLRMAGGLSGVRFVVEGLVLSSGEAESHVGQYVGIGPFPKQSLAYPLRQGHYPGPAEFVASAETARAHGWRVGQNVALPFGAVPRQVRLAGIYEASADGSGESPHALFFDLTWLRQEMDLVGKSNLLLVRSRSPEQRQLVAGGLTDAFPDYALRERPSFEAAQAFMTGLKIWAQVVGAIVLAAAMLLVTGTFAIATHERQRELAILRAVGATPAEATRLILREAGVLGICGSLVGLTLGWGIARLTLTAVATGTGIPAHSLSIPWLAVVLETIAGAGLAVAAARQPAQAAGALRPVAAMRPDDAGQDEPLDDHGQPLWRVLIRTRSFWLMVAGMAAVAWSQLLNRNSAGQGSLTLLGAATFAAGLVLAVPVLMPICLPLLARPLRPFFAVEAQLAEAAVLRHRRRSGLTVSIMLLSILLLVAMGAITNESQTNMIRQVQAALPYDAMITGPPSGPLDPSLAEGMRNIPGLSIAATEARPMMVGLVYYDWTRADPQWIAASRRAFPQLEAPERRFNLFPMDAALLARTTGISAADLESGVVLSVVVANRLGLKVGDQLTLVTTEQSEVFKAGRQGELLHFAVAAIVEGLPTKWESMILVSRTQMSAPDAVLHLTIDPARAVEVRQAVHSLLRGQAWGLVTFRDLREEIDRIAGFHTQVWALLGAGLITMLLVIAFSLVMVIVAGLHARRRELAILRAVGSTPLQLARQVVLEALLVAMTGGVLGLLGTTVVVGALVVGTNLQTYWLPLGLGAGAVVGGCILAALASLGPARSVTRGSAAEVLRLE